MVLGRFSDAFADALVDGKFNMDSFTSIFQGFIKQLISEATRLYIIKNILGGIGGSGGFTPDINQVASEAAVPLDAFGGRAGGGHVAKGFPYMVGERKPELFIPATAGRIVPNPERMLGNKTMVKESKQPMITQHFHGITPEQMKLIQKNALRGL